MYVFNSNYCHCHYIIVYNFEIKLGVPVSLVVFNFYSVITWVRGDEYSKRLLYEPRSVSSLSVATQ